MTDGAKEISNEQFFMRLGQRMIHIMTTQTPSGVLYEIDMRLRPDGNRGLLVRSLAPSTPTSRATPGPGSIRP
jgi:[glutamine synthetase] adenylyltransferase / [glutamine synthetase]-adenylyl-L-tyrosine phosphorylase